MTEDGEAMRYGMLGEDAASVEDKLEKYTGEVDWAYLKKPFEAGALLYVDPSLDLLAVGKAFTEDDAEAVKAWRSTGDIIQPGPPHADYWEESEAKFLALVVSPFVLIQPVGQG
jgi:hypothetical protein